MTVYLSDINFEHSCLCAEVSCTKYCHVLRLLHLLLQCLCKELNFHITIFLFSFFFLLIEDFLLPQYLKQSHQARVWLSLLLSVTLSTGEGGQRMLSELGCISVVRH